MKLYIFYSYCSTFFTIIKKNYKNIFKHNQNIKNIKNIKTIALQAIIFYFFSFLLLRV